MHVSVYLPVALLIFRIMLLQQKQLEQSCLWSASISELSVSGIWTLGIKMGLETAILMLVLRVAVSSGLSFADLLNQTVPRGHGSHPLGARRAMSNSSLGSFKWLPIKHLPPGYDWVPVASTPLLLRHFTSRTVVTLWKIFQLLHLIRGKNKLPKQVKLSRVSQQ